MAEKSEKWNYLLDKDLCTGKIPPWAGKIPLWAGKIPSPYFSVQDYFSAPEVWKNPFFRPFFRVVTRCVSDYSIFPAALIGCPEKNRKNTFPPPWPKGPLSLASLWPACFGQSHGQRPARPYRWPCLWPVTGQKKKKGPPPEEE